MKEIFSKVAKGAEWFKDKAAGLTTAKGWGWYAFMFAAAAMPVVAATAAATAAGASAAATTAAASAAATQAGALNLFNGATWNFLQPAFLATTWTHGVPILAHQTMNTLAIGANYVGPTLAAAAA